MNSKSKSAIKSLVLDLRHTLEDEIAVQLKHYDYRNAHPEAASGADDALPEALRHACRQVYAEFRFLFDVGDPATGREPPADAILWPSFPVLRQCIALINGLDQQAGRLKITGTPSRDTRASLKTAHTFMRTNAGRLGLSKDPADYDVHIQMVNLMGAKEGSEVGMVAFVAMISALLGKPALESLVVLGEMSLRGGLQAVSSLTERLQLAMDNGARRVLLPVESKRALLEAPADVLDKVQIIFFSDPINATFRAMGLD